MSHARWGPLGRLVSCSLAASPLPPMGDASVPTPLRTSPAPTNATNATICSKKPIVVGSGVALALMVL